MIEEGGNKRGLILPAGDPTERLVALWLHSKSPRTQRAYRADVRAFLAFVGVGFDRVSLELLQAYATSLEHARLSASTRSRRLASIKSLLAFGARLHVLPTDVGAALPLPKGKSTLAERILGAEQVGAILAGATNPRDLALVRLLFSGGLRVSEACGLRWRDVRPRSEGAQVNVFGKGSKTRVALVDATCYQALVALGKGKPDDPVFVGRVAGSCLSTVQAWRVVRRLARAAGIEGNVSPHWLRHAHASLALEGGAPIQLVRDSLGHASIETTGLYLHARPDQHSSRFLPKL